VLRRLKARHPWPPDGGTCTKSIMEFGPCQKGARHPAGSISTNEPGLRCHVIRRSTCRESKSVAAIGLIANFWIMEQFDDEGRPGGTRRRGDSQIPCTYILAREICGRSRSFECRKKFLFRISPVAAGLAGLDMRGPLSESRYLF